MRKAYRVKKEREFQAVFHTGDSFANRKFVVYRLKNRDSLIFELVYL